MQSSLLQHGIAMLTRTRRRAICLGILLMFVGCWRDGMCAPETRQFDLAAKVTF